MIDIKRKVITDNVQKSSGCYMLSQASINSDHNLVIRNYHCNGDQKSDEEILILNQREAKAIYDLFDFLREHNCLPF